MPHSFSIDDDASQPFLRNAVQMSPTGGCDCARHIQHLVAVGLVPQSGCYCAKKVVSRRTTVYQHVNEVV